MVFSSGVFIGFFLPVVLAVYYFPLIKSRKFRNIWLFLSSCAFYAYGEPVYIFLMLASVLINWCIALLLDRYKGKFYAKWLFIAGLVINISSLFIMKYADFFLQTINDISGGHIKLLEMALPIGISFYTFQAISYLADVYMQKANAQKNFINVGLYIAFFPQLVAGPIVRYNTIEREIQDRRETWEDLYIGIKRFLLGMGKKVLIANQIAVVADRAFSLELSEISMAMGWLGAIAYTLQIYFDFSGYSDMAIGLGRMFGFHFIENFKYPYIASSITEFWRRWHISLSSWFRDYIYIPLGGNGFGKKRQIFNLLIVWLLTGLWHGANWTFICWGIFYFILLCGEKLLGCGKGIIGHMYTLLCVMIAWVIFRAPDISYAIGYLGRMFAAQSKVDEMFLAYSGSYKLFILIGILGSIPIKNYMQKYVRKSWIPIIDIGIVGVGILAYSFVIRESYSPFIYFNF